MGHKESRIYLREFEIADAGELLELNRTNREIFEGITPAVHDDSFYTLDAHLKLIEARKQAKENGSRHDFGIFELQTDKLVGNIGLYRFGLAEKCVLGYSLDKDHHGKGYATEAVRLILDYAFKEVGFHRVEAGAMPRNIGSARVLEKAGFVREGLARDYIKIKGIWEDHYMFSILETDWQ